MAFEFFVELRRVYDQCESVASFRSDEAEISRLQDRFERIKLNTWMLRLLRVLDLLVYDALQGHHAEIWKAH